MRAYYDFQVFSWQKYGGISRYFYELATRIGSMGADVKTECIHSVNWYFREQLGMKDYSHNRVIRRIEQKAVGLLNRLNALRGMRGCDIVHPTYYAPYLLGHYKGKLVLTVYDMIHELYRDTYFSSDKKTSPRKARMLRAADRIIAISESTKRDILRFFPDIDPGKISVVHLGASMPAHDDSQPSPIDGDYVLFVGVRGGYKNFLRFVEAMRPILEMRRDISVFCVGGGGGFSAVELEAIGGQISRYHKASLDDEKLAQAYANALCFVFPSEYEGFGIPILESFACNCPLVCSNSSSFPEVAGDAAEYFDPLNVDEMSAKILRVIDDESLRERMKIAGRERLKLFDWDKTARETLECYRQVLGE